jgi:hypothetical protein
MKHLIRIVATAALATTFTSAVAFGQQKDTGLLAETSKPFQLALWSSVQASDNTTSIQGARLNLPYGKNRDVHGLDIGIANHATRDQYGVGAQIGLVNVAKNAALPVLPLFNVAL